MLRVKFRGRWRFATFVLLAVVLVGAIFITLYNPIVEISAKPNFLNVSINGPSKLSPQTPGQYTASVNNSFSGKLSYEWIISPSDNKTVLVSFGEKCNLTFTEATGEPYVLSVTVKDLTIGNLGYASITVHDPYTQSNLYIGAYGASYSYLIESDGLGWYQAVNGQTGQIQYSSTNNSYVLNSAFANGGKIVISGDMGVLSNYIRVFSNTEINGINGATLTQAANLDFIFKGASPSNVQITGINFTAVTSGRSVEAIGIDLGVLGGSGATNIKISDSIFQNFVYTTGTPSGIRGTYYGLIVETSVFRNIAGTSNAYPIYISGSKNVTVNGNNFFNGYDGNHIYFYKVVDFRITNNNLDGVNAAASLIEGLCIAGSTKGVIDANTITNNGVAGIYIHSKVAPEGESGAITVSNNIITNSLRAGTGRGIEITSDAGDTTSASLITLIGNTINNTLTGIMSGILNQNETNDATITGNSIANNNYAIALYNGHKTTLIGNTFVNSSISPAFIEKTGTLVISSNRGYQTESYGSVIFNGTETLKTITHNLGGTPTSILLTFGDGGVSPANHTVWYANPGGTTFQIVIDSAFYVAVSYFAKYDPMV